MFRYLYTLDKTCVSKKSDQTLEIIMTDLDQEKMKIFYREHTSSAYEATKVYFLLKIEISNSNMFIFRNPGLINYFKMSKFLIIYSIRVVIQ
jgi:hypothetical protein